MTTGATSTEAGQPKSLGKTQAESGNKRPLNDPANRSQQGSSGEFVDEETIPVPGAFKPTFDPTKAREKARARIAFALIALLAVTLLGVLFATLFQGFPTADAGDLFNSVLAPLIGLVGAATGFYYGADR